MLQFYTRATNHNQMLTNRTIKFPNVIFANKEDMYEHATTVEQPSVEDRGADLVATSISTTEDLVSAKRRFLKARSVRLHFCTGTSNK